MSELESYVNLGEQPTKQLAPRSVKIAFKAMVRHGTSSYYCLTFLHILSNVANIIKYTHTNLIRYPLITQAFEMCTCFLNYNKCKSEDMNFPC